MRLGNSFGNNKGKKYLRKSEIDVVYAKKAVEFNDWFAANYNLLCKELVGKQALNDDTLHETFMKMYDNVLFSNLECESYKGYFMRAYFTNFIQGSMKENRYCELLSNCDGEYTDSQLAEEREAAQTQLETDVMHYIYSKYSLRDFELFKMYMSLKPAINYLSLAQITGIKAHNIQAIVSKIKKDLRANKEFTKRRQELFSH